MPGSYVPNREVIRISKVQPSLQVRTNFIALEGDDIRNQNKVMLKKFDFLKYFFKKPKISRGHLEGPRYY